MKGIILAGGSATRFRPASFAVSKQLMPVYDKPLIYYPLSTLMLSGVREILLISSPKDITNYEKLFLNSNEWGISIEYAIQDNPNGLAEALIIGESFIEGNSSTLILGDNLFHGSGLGRNLAQGFHDSGAQIGAYHVANPKEFGVVEFDKEGQVITLEEKPNQPKSNWAVPGIYIYDDTASDRAKLLKPSARGELEITDLNISYLNDGKLTAKLFPRGTTWLDMGNPNSLLEAAEYVKIIQERQGTLIGSPEEAAWSMGWISDSDLLKVASYNGNTDYAKALTKILEEI